MTVATGPTIDGLGGLTRHGTFVVDAALAMAFASVVSPAHGPGTTRRGVAHPLMLRSPSSNRLGR